ncbi:MAG: winged helix-turn-helix domain-containing protein [Solirubrobacterales bacterium]|nr:winged helix-turn-helix domain-containing protein [Solirubrobacterales bacterium]
MRAQATAALRFGILGPLSASRDGEALALGGARQRALLAVLLVHANELVSTERLIEQLFNGSGSASSANAIHVAVSRLRRTLRDDGAEMLRTRRGGYVLELEPEQLDAAMFERLLSEGRSLLADGDHAAAAERLHAGLALWRGPPLADLGAVEDVQPEVRRLEELRLLAEMERVDAELALGHARDLVGPLQRLIAQAPLQERLRGQLMLALYRAGRQADALAVYREACTLLRDELGLTPSAELRELEHMILRHDVGLEPDRAQPTLGGTVLCPFKGLAAFEGSDEKFFCGRDRVVSELIARVAEWPLVGILGPSGIGKSSLLRAGVLPALAAGALPGSSSWRQVLLRPGEHPCAELERALGGPVGEVLGRLRLQERIVIAVDQLEEAFTACGDESECREFLMRLAAAAGDSERRALVLCTLRADFYGRLSAHARFAELLSRSHALVGPMDSAELREAIERPAALAGLEVEDRLVNVLVAELGDEPGALPLLSTTLLELWQARDGHLLRLQDYRATGGVRSGVTRIAEAAYTRLGHDERGVARELLLRLADLGDGAAERRRVSLDEVEGITGWQPVLAALTEARLVTVGPGAVELSHEALLREWPRYRGWIEEDRVGRRLHAHLRVTAAEWDSAGRDPGELYRGARLAAALEFCAQRPEQMDRLEREFVTASRAAAEREAARQRLQNRRLRALLLGAGLLLVLAVLAGVVAVIGQQQASSDARLAVADARAALGRQLGAEALGAPRLDVAALLAREAVALDRSPQTEGTLLSTLLRSPAVMATFALPTNSTPQVAVSPDGGTLAVSDSVANTVRFYDARSRALSARALNDFFGDQAPSYSPDGSLLAYRTGSELVVRDTATLGVSARLSIGGPFTQALTSDDPDGSLLIAPDDRTVYYGYWVMSAGGQPGQAYLARWALPSGRRLTTVALGDGPLLAMRLLDAGSRMMIVTPHGIRGYAAQTMATLGSVAIRPAPLLPTAAAISPDGSTVAIGSQNGAVWFVAAASGQARRGFGGHGATVASVVYGPDGGKAMTVGDDGRVIVWDPRALAELAVLPGPPERVRDAVLSPDGSTLYTSGVGGVLLAWDLTGQRGFGRSARVGSASSCCDPISPLQPALALSPGGSRFAVLTGPSTVGVFSSATLARESSFTIRPGTGTITALAWSPSGQTLAVGGHAGLVELWSLSGAPRYLRSLYGMAPLPGQDEAIQALAFSPDGQMLAASDKSQTSSLGHTSTALVATLGTWWVATGVLVSAPADLGGGNSINGSDVVAFSRDGRLLAVSLLTGGVRIYDPLSGGLVRTLSDPGDEGVALAFGPGGILAEGTFGGTVELWKALTGRRVAQPLLADSVAITSVAFDPTGQRFATAGSGDGTVKVWFTDGLQQEGPRLASDPGATSAVAFEPGSQDLLAVDDHGGAFAWPAALSAWQQDACALAGRNLTRAEWAQFVGGPRYSSVCP